MSKINYFKLHVFSCSREVVLSVPFLNVKSIICNKFQDWFLHIIFFRDIILGLERLCKNSKLKFAGKGNKYNWVLVLPILHFFRKECQPWTDVKMTMEYGKPEWWGVGGLGIDEVKDISDKWVLFSQYNLCAWSNSCKLSAN